MPETPLTAEQVEERLDQFLEPVLSSRRTAAAPARGLTGFDRARQEFVLRWVGIIASSNAEMAFQVASHAAQALKVMDEKAMEGWIIHAMDVYDKAGLHSAVAALKEIESYARELRARASGLVFEEVSRVLEAFVRGLSGRPLKLEAAEQIYTDTETLFLPAIVSRFPRREDNFRLYKAVTVHLWAQTWFGTWRMSLAQAAAGFGDAARAVRAFHALEILRLDACIARELPGVHRDMNALRAALGEEAPPSSPVWYQAAEILSRPGAGVEESYRWLPRVYAEELPRPLSYQGGLYPERVEQQMALRREREKQAFRVALAKLLDERRAPREPSPIADERDKAPRRFELHEQRQEDAEQPDGFIYELWLDGQPVVPPEDVKGLMESIIQDLGEIPDDYLVPAGDGAYHAVEHAQRDPKDVWKGMYHEEGAFLYNEWDYERRHYRKNWCVLREIDVHPRQDDFPARTLIKYSGLVKVLRRTFEALRGEDKTLKKQPYGDDVDIDALVEAYADVASGREMSERLFTKLH
ncbi:MAG: hypothetical protein KGJ12_08440, partial [Gammaproteobacteria bacterium]|nr:hypothetical protein [Gammaproteobacteria bacterium]